MAANLPIVLYIYIGVTGIGFYVLLPVDGGHKRADDITRVLL